MGKNSEASAEASQKAAAGVAESAEAHPGHEQAHGDACACGHCHDHEHEHEHHHEHEAAPVDRVLGTAPDFAYHVLGIDCPHCAKSCENAVRTLQTVEDARLVYATATLEVVKKPEATGRECRREVLETVRSCGQDLELSDEEREELEAKRSWWETNRQKVLLGSSGILLGVGLVAEHLLSNVAVADVAYVVAAICGLVFILPMAVASLRRKTADMNVLMSIAVIGGILLGAYGEAAMVIFLDQVGEWLEGWSMRKTSSSIKELMSLAPPTAHVVGEDGAVSDVAVADVEEGQVIRVLAGERVPLDGRIVAGSSSFDEAPVTGESVPQDKGVGAEVFNGALNANAVVDVEVTADEDESTIARIISMVQGAQAEKAPYESFIDRFAEVYTPIVIAIAAVVGVVVPLALGAAGVMVWSAWRDWVYRALSLLVVACPCALVISTPVSFVSAITRAAKIGVLVKGGACFDTATKVDAVAFDKTGTLTTGKPKVVDVFAVEGVDADALVATAAALESNSTHPLARAIVARSAELGAVPLAATDVEEVAGNGMRGQVEGVPCAIGKMAFAQDQGVVGDEVREAAERMAGKGATSLVVMAAGRPMGVIAVADTIRETSRAALSDLRAAGVSELEMLTGDNRHTAAVIAKEAGVTSVSAELLPEGKVERIRELRAKGDVVCMVGDGINDAPALAAADLGVTMGAAASDTALEVADVALLSDDLSKLPEFFRLSHRTMNVVRENVTFALVVKAVIMVLVIAGIAGMGAAVFADTGVALIVILNGMRLMTNTRSRF
ncbi:MAG: cation-translocating P-type ATPase [Atopobiaceae bacterium]|jgi:Cd2+/Zn2+-exporting ATPase|nr:cation-translocating P-type ATPase [Atopobiaceae bacterium]MCH4119501.1 cation-translocating P-type ATPase [Atopobiaceae bacterium]MCI1389614.1 cation-translocating P-type ATPase [Atopobiaceae bacterium]MCI1431678.1 cation-translocating P-type ATPase [Atopobiaceae bacterium]MCI1470114.1 cation-translocating P-type ATPase [Atopobiaceae bacterium]